MTGLSAALNFARSSLQAVAGQSALASRNVASANNPDYTKKNAALATHSTGMVVVTGTRRATEDLLLDKLITSSGNAAAGSALLAGLQRLSETQKDGDSPSSLLAKFQSALQLYEQNPADGTRAQAAVQAASALTRGLNSASAATSSVRSDADSGIATQVEKLNDLLGKFKIENDAITSGQPASVETAEHMDNRDALARQISEIVGVRIVRRPNNDMALYTDSGVTLFERDPRTLSFLRSSALGPGSAGQALFIDGVDVSSASSPMPLRSGTIFGLTKLRDDTSLRYQSQLDEVARGLVAAFAETDQNLPPSLPTATGLFTYPGAPSIPAAGLVANGLAATITVSKAVDPNQGGIPARLRDGGINGAAYVYNNSGAAGFSQRLSSLIDGLSKPQSFDPQALLDSPAGLRAYAAQSTGWIEGRRLEASTAADLQAAVKTRASEALQRVSGVSIDDEMTEMLQFERSYQASSKLISTVDSMFSALLNAVG